MPSENEVATERMQWGPLIRAIAVHQDRGAFATLFEYFGPRIKAFMQRSGASEGSAEELAQETMLAVWRKAALFDPATTVRRPGFSRSPAICASMRIGANAAAA